MSIAVNILLVISATIMMEGVAYYGHKYIMHGMMWSWHKSHHEPHDNTFEKNDLFAVVFSIPSIVMIFVGLRYAEPLLYIGLGIALYGFIYFVFHDIIVHQRIKVTLPRRSAYLKRIIQAHRLHHAVESKEGAVSFGFLYASPARDLKDELKRINDKLSAENQG